MKAEQIIKEWPIHLPWLNQSQNDLTFLSVCMANGHSYKQEGFFNHEIFFY